MFNGKPRTSIQQVYRDPAQVVTVAMSPTSDSKCVQKSCRFSSKLPMRASIRVAFVHRLSPFSFSFNRCFLLPLNHRDPPQLLAAESATSLPFLHAVASRYSDAFPLFPCVVPVVLGTRHIGRSGKSNIIQPWKHARTPASYALTGRRRRY